MKRVFLSCVLACLAFFPAGCVFTSYTDKDGRKLQRLALGAGTHIGELSITDTGATLRGYSNEQAEVAAAVVNAAVSAAKK